MRKILSMLMVTTLLMACGWTAFAATEEWRVFPKRYDGVSIAIKTHYFPFDCEVNWRFTNHNSYPVKIEISNKIYVTNYGLKSIPNSYQTYAELQPNETKAMAGLGDHLSYGDKDFGEILDSRGIDRNRKKVPFFVVEGLKNWEYKVTQLNATSTGSGNASGGGGAPGALAKRTTAGGKEQWLLKCHEHEEETWVDKDDVEVCEVQGQSGCSLAGTDLIHIKGVDLSGAHVWAFDRKAYNQEQANTSEGSWMAFPGQFKGVTVAVKFDYLEDGCNMSWRSTNNNSYPVKVKIFKKNYSTNYGNCLVNNTVVLDLQPGEGKSFTEYMSYGDRAFGGTLKNRNTDKNGRSTTLFTVSGVNSWECEVTKLVTTTQPQNKTRGGLKVPPGAKTTR